jgi:hypothetical protein
MTVNCGESKEADEKFFNAPDGQPYLNMEMIQPEVESPAVF